jgi:hypothetical protein
MHKDRDLNGLILAIGAIILLLALWGHDEHIHTIAKLCEGVSDRVCHSMFPDD